MAGQGQGNGKPKVNPFSPMGLCHVALRFRMSQLEKAFSSDNLDNLMNEEDLEQYASQWKEMSRCMDIHGRQENEVFFPKLKQVVEDNKPDSNDETIPEEKRSLILKRFVAHDDSSLSNNGTIPETTSFFSQHHIEEEMREAVTKAFQSKDTQKIQETLLAWITDIRVHLDEEEQVMMPMTGKTANSFLGLGAVVRSILAVDRKEFNTFQFGYVLSALADRKKSFFSETSNKSPEEKKKSKGMMKMYILGTQASSSKEEYDELKPIIKEILEEADYEAFKPAIEQDGKQEGKPAQSQAAQKTSENNGAAQENPAPANGCCALL